MALVNLVVWNNNAGFTRDAKLVTDLLTAAGHEVHQHHLAPPGLLARMRQKMSRLPMYAANIFFQNIVPEWLPFARANVLLPNPEHFGEAGLPLLRRMDAILCKTHSAVHTFSKWNSRTTFIGFTSDDRWDTLAHRQSSHPYLLHVVGQSTQKGTPAVIEAWRRNPTFPPLRIIARAQSGVPSLSVPDHVTVLSDFLPDAELRDMQNRCAIHVAPSEVEGFGHTLMESMSAGGCTITLDAPPMNELITSQVGELAAWRESASMHLATRYYADPDFVADAVKRTLELDPSVINAKRVAARSRFEQLDREFRTRFHQSVAELLPSTDRLKQDLSPTPA